MSKRYKKPPGNLKDFKDKLEREGCIPVQTEDGQTFYIRPPELLTDDEFKKFQQSDDEIEQAAILVKNYDEFKAAGGSAMLMASILAAQDEEGKDQEQGADLGEDGDSSSS